MVGEIISLASFGYSTGVFGDLLNRLGEAGFFSFVLPFLLLFALVYGILLKTNLFPKNSLNVLISFVVALMAIQFDFVGVFFSQVFPRMGVALGGFLVLLIISGLMFPKENWVIYALFGVSILTVVAVLAGSANFFGYGISYWLMDNWPLIAGLIFVIAVIALMTQEKDKPGYEKVASKFLNLINKD